MSQERRRLLSWLGFWALAAVALSPYLTTGFYQDDVLNSLYPWDLALKGLGFWSGTLSLVKTWIIQGGRLYPVGLLFIYSLWYGPLHHLWLYRLIQVGAIALNIGLFLRMLRSWGATRSYTLFCGVALLAAFQIRNYHDPMTSYGCLLQFLVLCGQVSLLSLGSYLRAPSKQMLALTSAALLCALLTYEVALFFVPPLLAVIFTHTGPPAARKRALWAVGGAAGAYLLAVAGIRAFFPPTYTGIMLQPGAASLKAFLAQASAAFPLLYPVFGRSGFFEYETLLQRPIASWATIVYAVAFFFPLRAWIDDARGEGAPEPQQELQLRCRLHVFAASMVFGPALFIGLSARYQHEIGRPGHGYLPVYMSYFGACVYLGLGFQKLVMRTSKRACAAWASCAACVLALAWGSNRVMASALIYQHGMPRAALEQALEAGFGSAIQEGQGVLVHTPAIDDRGGVEGATDAFFLKYLGRRLHLSAPWDWFILIEADRQGRRRYVLGAIQSVEMNRERGVARWVETRTGTLVAESSEGSAWSTKRLDHAVRWDLESQHPSVDAGLGSF